MDTHLVVLHVLQLNLTLLALVFLAPTKFGKRKEESMPQGSVARGRVKREHTRLATELGKIWPVERGIRPGHAECSSGRTLPYRLRGEAVDQQTRKRR